MDASVTVDAESREVFGFAQVSGGYSGRFGGVRIYFVARFDRAFTAHGVWDQGAPPRAGESEGERGAWVSFDPAGGAAVRAEVAMSFVDVAGARANLEAETADFDFDAVRAESEAEWESWLSRVRVEGRSETDFRRFYTALYHSLLMPTLASDVDGRYRGLDGEVHTAEGFDYFTDFSLWDTFRTLHPLLTLLYPEVQTDMLAARARLHGRHARRARRHHDGRLMAQGPPRLRPARGLRRDATRRLRRGERCLRRPRIHGGV